MCLCAWTQCDGSGKHLLLWREWYRNFDAGASINFGINRKFLLIEHIYLWPNEENSPNYHRVFGEIWLEHSFSQSINSEQKEHAKCSIESTSVSFDLIIDALDPPPEIKFRETKFCTYFKKLSFSSFNFSASLALYFMRRSTSVRFSSCK